MNEKADYLTISVLPVSLGSQDAVRALYNQLLYYPATLGYPQ